MSDKNPATKIFIERIYKDFTLQGLSDVILSTNEVVGTYKVCILTALKLASQAVNIVKLIDLGPKTWCSLEL